MKTKSTRRVSKQKEVEGAILNAIQKFRFEDNVRHEVILAALLFSAEADEIEEGFRTAVPLREALLSPKPRRKTATQTKTRR